MDLLDNKGRLAKTDEMASMVLRVTMALLECLAHRVNREHLVLLAELVKLVVLGLQALADNKALLAPQGDAETLDRRVA
ncbi:hypothetical protein [Salmonella sp. s54412]|uniref:hypothetical protein n=1 Tax=unclassified Salmonella TaxID=2614656 RepID=UPI0037553E40